MSFDFNTATIATTSPGEDMGFRMACVEVFNHFYAPAHNATLDYIQEALSHDRHREWLLYRRVSAVLERARIRHDDNDRLYRRALSYFATPVRKVVRAFGLSESIPTCGFEAGPR